MTEKPTEGLLEPLFIKKKKSPFLFQPDNLFFLITILLSPLPLFFTGQSIGVHLYDTFYLLPHEYFIYLLALLFLLVWILYKLTKTLLLSPYLTWFHFICSLIILAAIFSSFKWMPRTYSSTPQGNTPQDVLYRSLLNSQFHNLKLSLQSSILLIAGTLAYIVNLTGGLTQQLFKKRL